MGKDIYVGSQGIGDRFVQAGTSALFRDGAKVIAELSECSLDGIDFRFHVLEYDDELMERSDFGVSRRYGDRTYVVRDMIG